MKQSLFREVSLKRLSSPEQLDQLIKVTSPRAWLVLVALGLILVSMIVWSFLGSIPAKIEGQGILLNNGEIVSLVHDTSGQVIDVRFKAGDRVKKGDIIARIELPELVEKINDLQSTLQDMERNQNVTSPEYQRIKDQVQQLREKLDYQTQIVSPIEGRILELNINKGSLIQAGESLATLEQYGAKVRLEAVIYVPAEQGGKIRPGMEVQISPSIVKKEEVGFMLGRVIAVSEYPATTQGMMKTLGNEKLVSLLTGQGASLEVQADLIADSSTSSGYKWSSPAGPALSIPSGTLIHGAVVVSREKPISKVIPFWGTRSNEAGRQ